MIRNRTRPPRSTRMTRLAPAITKLPVTWATNNPNSVTKVQPSTQPATKPSTTATVR
jgi:hypothetical protein